jgi:uridine kinase
MNKEKELKRLKKKIKGKQEDLDEIIRDFNRKNSPEDERLIVKFRKELDKLNADKEELESEIP